MTPHLRGSLLNDLVRLAGLEPATRCLEGLGLGRPDLAVRMSGVFKEVFVYPLDYVCLLLLNADVVLNHQTAERWTVNQDYSGSDTIGIGCGFGRKTAGGDEDAPVGPGAM